MLRPWPLHRGHCFTLMSFCFNFLNSPLLKPPFHFKGPSLLRRMTTQSSWAQPWWQKWPPRVRHGATRWAFCHQTRSRTVLDGAFWRRKSRAHTVPTPMRRAHVSKEARLVHSGLAPHIKTITHEKNNLMDSSHRSQM